MSVPSHFGRYRVLRPLATGEMGVVYLAEDPLIGRRVAIKGIRFDPHTEDSEIQRLQARFDQEIQIAGTFSHPNIVTLFDVGRQDGRSFIAMEYVEGRNLRAELQAHGRMSVSRTVELTAPLARALAYAHDRKIVHRDIKPTNILVSCEGIAKITDFGVARLYNSTLTNAGKIFGTPAYMSPEQAIGGELSGASDQFAIAAVVYELLTGERPFKGTSPTAVIYEVIEHHPEPPHELVPLVPEAIGRVVMRGLEKNPEDRFESCLAFAEALETAAAWSKANPEEAYLSGPVPEPPQIAAAVEATAPTLIPVASMRRGMRRVVDAVAAAKLPSRARDLASNALRLGAEARSLGSRIPRIVVDVRRDPRGLTALATGTLGVAALVIVVTIVATAGLVSQGPGRAAAGMMAAAEAASSGATNPGIRTAGTLGSDTSSIGASPSTSATGNGGDPGRANTASARSADLATDAPRAFVISTRPSGARVFLDGEPVAGTSPIEILVDPLRRYTLGIEMDGFRSVAWSFALTDLGTAHLEAGELYFPLQAVAAVEAVPEEELPVIATPWSADLIGGIGPPVASTTVAEGPVAPIDSGPPPAPMEIRRVRAPTQTPTPEKLHHVDPELPGSVEAAGVVVLEIEVSARGNVVQAKVLRGMNPAVDQAALAAAVRWKYEPTVVSGAPVHVLMTVTLPITRSPGSGSARR